MRPRRTGVRSITTSAVAAIAGSHVSCNPPPLPLLCARRGRPARRKDPRRCTLESGTLGLRAREYTDAGEETAAAIARGGGRVVRRLQGMGEGWDGGEEREEQC